MIKIVATGLTFLSAYLTTTLLIYALCELNDMVCAEESEHGSHEKANHA